MLSTILNLSEPRQFEHFYECQLNLETIGPRYEDARRELHKIFVYIPIDKKRSVDITNILHTKIGEIKQSFMATTRGLNA